MKAIKMTLAALMAVFAITTASAQSAEAGAKYNEAAAKYNAKDFAAALPLLQEAVNIALDADDVATAQNAQKLIPQANFQQGLALAKAQKLEEAIPFLEAAMETGELYNVAAAARNAKTMISQVYTMLGGQAFNNKDYAKAAEVFAKGYAANNQDTAIGMNLAMSYCEMGDMENGIKVYKEIIALADLHSKFAEPAEKAKAAAANYLVKQASEQVATDAEAAFASLAQALEIDATNATAHLLRIQTAATAQAWDKIIEWGDAAAEAQTTDEAKSDVYYYLAAAYDSTDVNDKAIEVYGKVTAGNNAEAAAKRITELKALNK